MKISLTTIITLFIFLTESNAFSQKLTRQEVESKLPKSWTATKTGKPGETLFPVKNKEIIDFKPDGSLNAEYYSDIMGNTNSKVFWGFDEKNQKLIMTLPNGSLSGTLEFEIIELTEDKLVLMTPEKQTVFIPTKIIEEETLIDDVLKTGLNPNIWSGKLQYNIVIKTDHYYKTSKERVPGEITLEKLGEKKIIRKKELGSTLTWTITNVSYKSNITRYIAVCTDLNFNGEISFENGFLALEIYKPKYSKYLFAVN